MKKIIIRVILILLALLVIWVLANRFDASLTPDLFSMKDIPAASFDKSNGFYYLWSLSEPPDVDVTSDTVIEKYRGMFDPQFDNKKYIREYNPSKYKGMFYLYRDKFEKMGVDFQGKIDITGANWYGQIFKNKEKFSSLDPDLQVFLNRFRSMVECPVFEDFTAINADAPLPNLLAWLRAAKFYTAVNLLTALNGEWDKGVSNLLDMLDFGKRAVKGSRFLIVNLVSKGIMQLPMTAITYLMNQKECPNSVYEMVLKRTPPLQYEEFGTRQTIICEVVAFTFDFIEYPSKYSSSYSSLNLWDRSIIFLFLQKNRTKNYANQFYKQFIEREQTPPYQWDSDYVRIDPLKEGPFWWLWNAGGKFLLTSYNGYTGNHKKNEGLYAVIFKSYMKKAMYDMIRISAELHLKYDPDKPVQEILNSLDSYKVMDPCSGKPYKWNDEKQVLYSIGTDRTDNGGFYQHKIKDSDFMLPVILYVKTTASGGSDPIY